jgi:hypothetical protein
MLHLRHRCGERGPDPVDERTTVGEELPERLLDGRGEGRGRGMTQVVAGRGGGQRNLPMGLYRCWFLGRFTVDAGSAPTLDG